MEYSPSQAITISVAATKLTVLIIPKIQKTKRIAQTWRNSLILAESEIINPNPLYSHCEVDF
jgi:hypothetical protein